MNFDELPDSAILREKQIIPDLIPVSRSTWRAGIHNGLYPPPKKIGLRSIGWTVASIRNLLDNLEEVTQ